MFLEEGCCFVVELLEGGVWVYVFVNYVVMSVDSKFYNTKIREFESSRFLESVAPMIEFPLFT